MKSSMHSVSCQSNASLTARGQLLSSKFWRPKLRSAEKRNGRDRLVQLKKTSRATHVSTFFYAPYFWKVSKTSYYNRK